MKNFVFREAQLSDIEALVELEERVEQGLPSRQMFAIDGPDFYRPIVAGAGRILLAFDSSNELAGVNVIRYPEPDDPENLAFDVGLPASDMPKVRHVESFFLRSDCRGLGLAYRLLCDNLHLSDRDGKEISLATVWPCNWSSLNLLLGYGFFIRAFAFKYGGKPRFILMHTPREPRFSDEAHLVSAKDLEAHKRHLADGMAGVGCLRGAGDDILIEYRRILH